MNRESVEKLFLSLAQSQGYYGRLLRDIRECLTKDEQEKFYEQFKDCKSDVDVILMLEC